MLNVLAVFAGLAALYCAFVAWFSRQARWVGYHTFWSPILLRCTNHMAAMTLWNWTFLLQGLTPLDAAIRRHEDTHVAQFAARPYLFPFLYLTSLALHGYQRSPYEIEARLAEAPPVA